MENRISISDYNVDWAYIENFQHPRSHKGYLTRENVVSFYGTLGVDVLNTLTRIGVRRSALPQGRRRCRRRRKLYRLQPT
jgi:hypothetical protein